MKITDTIPKSDSDLILEDLGYNLPDEYLYLIKEAGFKGSVIYDFATGTGRASAILTRLDYNVITGDYNLNKKPEAERRITAEYLNKVEFLKLNMECLPFKTGQIKNIICLNTLHELSDPVKCLNEIIRIHSSEGKLLIADFNTLGFNVMDKLHQIKFNQLHPRGGISAEMLENILREKYLKIKPVNTELNYGFIVLGRK